MQYVFKGENEFGSQKIMLMPRLNHCVNYMEVIWRKLLPNIVKRFYILAEIVIICFYGNKIKAF